MDIQFDAPNEDELKFILDSWSSSYRKSVYAGTIPNNLWQEVIRASITQLVGRPLSKTIVARVGGRVMGYVVAEPGILHWLYVKKDFRRLGIGNELLAETVSKWPENLKKFPRYTHNTYGAQRFLPKWWKWDPIPARVQSAG